MPFSFLRFSTPDPASAFWFREAGGSVQCFLPVLWCCASTNTVPHGFVQNSTIEFGLTFLFGSAGVRVACCSPWGQGVSWCSFQFFGWVPVVSPELMSWNPCRSKFRAQRKFGAREAANKCFQFVASPPDAACGGAAEASVKCHKEIRCHNLIKRKKLKLLIYQKI